MDSVTRSRRYNAGSKMSALLDKEENIDHFYDNLYGGFKEDDNDGDYNYTEDTDEDIVDSDFSIDENELTEEEEEKEVECKRKKRKQEFGCYQTKSQLVKPKRVEMCGTIESENMVIPFELDMPFEDPIISSHLAVGDNALVVNLKSNNELHYFRDFDSPVKVLYNKSGKELTQNELLAEAMITEKVNLQSLKEWEMLEQSKAMSKSASAHKINVPFIRYHSVAMPLIEELNGNHSDQSSNDQNPSLMKCKNYSRTFISFSDEETYKSSIGSIHKSSSSSTKGTTCPVTQLPARYFDPISQLPYANAEAFRVIRDYYYNSLEKYGNTNQKDILQWIEWRRNNEDKWKEWQQKHSPQSETEVALECKLLDQTMEKMDTREPTKRSACRSSRKRKKFF